MGPNEADALESLVVGEYSRDDFEGAMKYVRGLPDAQAKVRMLLDIIQKQRAEFY